MNGDSRPEPESFFEHAPAPVRGGRLKVYLGGAAGVGKTYRMLEEAHQLRASGHDVVLGFVETHGRAETAARIGDLEQVPPREITYRDVALKEMDLDAIIARRPEYAIVDELAHSNAPGSRHNKRYQDVEELLDHGINVITALNVQHLESLRGVVKRLTGVEVNETVPDTFVARAGAIVTVDVPVEELRERLRTGKIYPAERIEAALKNFFKPANLASLRELALREAAREQARSREQSEELRRDRGRRVAVGERVMVCLSANPEGTQALLRKAARGANRVNAEWFAVHVETSRESIQKISTAAFRTLLDNINLAADLGAETVWLKSEDVAKALLDFAHEKKISRIVIGRTRPSLWTRLWGKSVTARLIAEARDFDLEITGELSEEAR